MLHGLLSASWGAMADGPGNEQGMDTETSSAEDDPWLVAALPVPAPLCDAFFVIAESVYVGPENGMSAAQWEAERVPLPRPDLPLHPRFGMASAGVLGREDVLAEHYERVIRVVRAHGKDRALEKASPLFAIRPFILEGEEAVASWPWNDTLSDTLAVLDVLCRTEGAAPGAVVLDDLEQGWRLRMIAGRGTVRLVEWDGEGPPPAYAGRCLDTAVLAGQAAAARDRLRAIHGRLRRLLGRDFWS